MCDLGQRPGICQCLIGFVKMTRFGLVGSLVQLRRLAFCGNYD